MKAIVQDTYGPVDVLELGEIDRPVPADDEVLVHKSTYGESSQVRRVSQ